MMKSLAVFIAIILSGVNNKTVSQNLTEKTITNNDLKVNYQIITSINNTWGYDIFIEGKLKIHQPTIPCFNGVEGFKTEASAAKVAKLVMGKMRKGEIPPMITIDEMKKLKVI